MARKRPREAEPGAQPGGLVKKSRQFSEQAQRLAKVYQDLASEVGDVRINAAKSLLEELSPKNVEDDSTLERALFRLIRGLCSSRKAARLGFFIALTELLRQCFIEKKSLSTSLSLKDVPDLVVKSTEPDGRVSGQERRDYLIGRISGCNAILLSNILTEPAVAGEEIASTLEILCSLARAKQWLREEYGHVLYSYARSLHGSTASPVGQILMQALSQHGQLKSPEGVAVWLALQSQMSAGELPKNVWKNDDPLYSKNWRVLADVLRTGQDELIAEEQSRTAGQKGGTSRTNASFAWTVVIDAFVHQTGAETSFEKFWRDLVDNNLFAQSSTDERKQWGFQILSHVIAKAPAWTVPHIFSPNILRCLINQRTGATRFLHSAALEPLNQIRKRVTKEPVAAPIFLKTLLRIAGVTNFDAATKSKTIHDILSKPLDKDASEALAHVLTDQLHFPDADKTDAGANEAKRNCALDWMALLGRSQSISLTEESSTIAPWMVLILQELTRTAYLKSGQQNIPVSGDKVFVPYTEHVQTTARLRLQSVLGNILNSSSDKHAKAPLLVVDAIFVNGNLDTSSKLIMNIDKAVRKRLTSSYKALREAQNNQTTLEPSVLNALLLFHCLALLQVFEGDADAVSMLDDVEALYNPQSHDPNVDEDDQSHMLIELLLSFLSKPSSLFRKLAEQVFTAFTPNFTAASLQTLIDVLAKPESLVGQQELFDEDEAEEGIAEDCDDDSASTSDVDSDDNDDSASLDSDVEIIDAEEESQDDESDSEGKLKSNGHAEDEDTEAEDEKAVSSGEDEDEEELLKLDAVLAQTLGVDGRPNTEPTADDSDADMDDDEMMALEPALTKIFQERRKAATSNKKQQRKDAKETMTNLKNRILDLLQIYIKKEQSNILALALILPLVKLMHETSTRQLAEHAFNILKTYFDGCKGKDLPNVETPEQVFAMLHDVHDAVERNDSKMYSVACSRSSLFLARVLLAADGTHFDRVQDIYSTTMKHRRQRKKSKIQRSFFLDWTNYAYDFGH